MDSALQLDPALAAVVERARLRAGQAGELTPPTSPQRLPTGISDDLGEVLATLLRDGTYSKAVKRVAGDDPDLADS